MSSKLEKEKLKLVQEKCQSLLNDMLRDEDNKYCVDCDAKGPRWASWNLGVFLCIRCAGIHRNLGVHISKVKSVNLDTWTPEQVVTVQAMGNSRARAVYEAFLPDNFRRPQTDSTLETFIRAKYEHKKYIAKEWVMPKIGKVDWDSEIEETLRAKKSTPRSEIKLPLPKPPTNNPAQSQTKQKPIEVANGGSIAKSISSASSDLLGLSITTPSTTAQQQQSNNNFNFLTEEPTLSLVDTTTPTGTDNTSTPTASMKSVNDDLGSIFMSGPVLQASPADNQLTKESILSLYKTTSPASAGPQQQPGLNTLNPFLNFQQTPIQQQQQVPGGVNLAYGGGQFIGGSQQGSNSLDFMQLSSQLSGLGLTNTAQPAYQPFPQGTPQAQYPNMHGQFNQFNQFNNIPSFYNQPPQAQPQYQPKYK